MKIVSLCAIYNRKEASLRSASSLIAACEYAGVELEMIVVDDGSTDGSAEAVRALVGNVKIIETEGDRYWAGAMRRGWEEIKGSEFDFLLVYNDDIELLKDSIERMVLCANYHVDKSDQLYLIAGSFYDGAGSLSYGGLRTWSKIFPLSFRPIRPRPDMSVSADVANMNLCLIPKRSLDSIGFFADYFVHGGADYEYCLRLKNVGGEVLVAPGFFGKCDRNSIDGSPLDPSISGLSRLKASFSIKETPIRQMKFFYREYAGRFWFFFLGLFYMSRLLRPFFGAKLHHRD
jgi:GT2 family glycosyltransferase